MDTLKVKVPKGAKPGKTTINVLAGGVTYAVKVPKNKKPGSTFEFQVPVAPQVYNQAAAAPVPPVQSSQVPTYQDQDPPSSQGVLPAAPPTIVIDRQERATSKPESPKSPVKSRKKSCAEWYFSFAKFYIVTTMEIADIVTDFIVFGMMCNRSSKPGGEVAATLVAFSLISFICHWGVSYQLFQTIHLPSFMQHSMNMKEERNSSACSWIYHWTCDTCCGLSYPISYILLLLRLIVGPPKPFSPLYFDFGYSPFILLCTSKEWRQQNFCQPSKYQNYEMRTLVGFDILAEDVLQCILQVIYASTYDDFNPGVSASIFFSSMTLFLFLVSLVTGVVIDDTSSSTTSPGNGNVLNDDDNEEVSSIDTEKEIEFMARSIRLESGTEI